MTSLRVIAISLSCAVLTSPLLYAGDLSRYRDFRLGADIPTIAGLARMDTSDAKVMHKRPALIQELDWHPQLVGPSTEVGSVDGVVFSFYNGELYRLVVSYDRYKTEGLTAEDLIEGISATYGPATRDAAKIVVSSVYEDNETLDVLARWEDAQYSFSLVRFSRQPSFTLVAMSKRLDALARTAITEATRLDVQEAPQREIELQKKNEDESRQQQEKARLANKPNFRP
ncbi:MAG: hypothetical protein ABFD89_17255 [Bryobacteraceae bacterium]